MKQQYMKMKETLEYKKGYEDCLDKCKDFADEIYKFFCKKQNWNSLKDQWLENGGCHWLKQKINDIFEEFKNHNT